MEELKHKVGLGVAQRVAILRLHHTSLNTCHLHAHLLACFYEIHLKFLTSHIYFHLDDSELWKQYQSVSQKMMGQMYDLETVEPQEVPIRFV